jgi:dUTPase
LRWELVLKSFLPPDQDYQWNLYAVLHNYGETPITLPVGKKFLQLLIIPYFTGETSGVDDSKKEREGGFGSTDDDVPATPAVDGAGRQMF